MRGLKQAKAIPIERVNSTLGTFDTLLMLGNNFGLFGSFDKARRLLKRFYRMTADEAQIIAQCLDPYDTEDPCHLRYHKRNIARGRMSGQVRMRVRYRDMATPWFDYLFVSTDEMEKILENTGWRIQKIVEDNGPTYIVVISKV